MANIRNNYDLDGFIKEIQCKNNIEEIEFELKLFLDKQYQNGKLVNIGYSHDEIKKIFKTLFETLAHEYQMEEHQYVNIISRDGVNKQFEYVNGLKDEKTKLLYAKTRIKDYFMSNKEVSWKVKACREHKLTNFSDSKVIYNLIRFKRRFSMTITDEWRIDYTFVIQLPYQSTEIVIKDSRELLFLTELHRIYDVAHCVEVEIEYIKPLKFLTSESIQNVLTIFPAITMRPTVELYDLAINQLKEMFSEKVIKNSTRRLSMKQLLPQTFTLNKKEYFKMLADKKYGEYYVSHKLNGERVLLFIDVANSGFLTTTQWNSFKINTTINFSLILDCELYNNTFYVFDILKYVCNTAHVAETFVPYTLNMHKCPYLLRRKCLNSLREIIERLGLSNNMKILIKPSYKLGACYAATLNMLVNQTTGYPRDGIVFTSVRESYLNTQYLKWKPTENMTIEFITKKCPNNMLGAPPYSKRRGKTLYLLFVGIRADMLSGFGIKRLHHYHALFPTLVRRDYFPIQFAPSSEPLAYLFWSDQADLDNKIVELIWAADQWQLLHIRQDRQADYLNHQYFGNDYSVAESIWNTYSNPFPFEELKLTYGEMKKQFYFVEDDSEQHRGIRKFNNLVKTKLLESFGLSQHWVIDLGSGKGQDFIKYLYIHVQNVIFVDNNISNIDEIITRKYLYYKQGHFKNTTMNVHTVCQDLIQPDFYRKIAKFVPHCKLIVCNFAIHYMCYNNETAKIFAANISELLQNGGRFMCTYLSGSKIFDKIMNNVESDYSEWVCGKYHIRRYFWGDTYTGTNQQISIKLPFSDGFYYEYLFNIDLLAKELKPYKITLEMHGQFNEYVKTYQLNTDMNNKQEQFGLKADDLEYVTMLEYAVFHKK